jgi:hypothetical protein
VKHSDPAGVGVYFYLGKVGAKGIDDIVGAARRDSRTGGEKLALHTAGYISDGHAPGRVAFNPDQALSSLQFLNGGFQTVGSQFQQLLAYLSGRLYYCCAGGEGGGRASGNGSVGSDRRIGEHGANNFIVYPQGISSYLG